MTSGLWSWQINPLCLSATVSAAAAVYRVVVCVCVGGGSYI